MRPRQLKKNRPPGMIAAGGAVFLFVQQFGVVVDVANNCYRITPRITKAIFAFFILVRRNCTLDHESAACGCKNHLEDFSPIVFDDVAFKNPLAVLIGQPGKLAHGFGTNGKSAFQITVTNPNACFLPLAQVAGNPFAVVLPLAPEQNFTHFQHHHSFLQVPLPLRPG